MTTQAEPPMAETVNEADASRAEELKAEANKLFAETHYEAAAEKYSAAIALNPTVAAYYSNRSIAYFKEEAYGFALRDADEAIRRDPKFLKAYYRRASAHVALQKLGLALKDLQMVVKFAPNDPDARAKYKAVEQESRRLAFEKALSYDATTRLVSKTLDVASLTVPASYDGPRMDGDALTLEFVQAMTERFREKRTIHSKYAYGILLLAKKHLEQQSSLVNITVPPGGRITVCGDTHGQFYDLLQIFELAGAPGPQNLYLFNGDFVDRGNFSVEIIFTLLAYKLLYPDAFHLSRGNHEADDMNRMYGFQTEVNTKYSPTMFSLFSEVFNCIPIANVIQDKVIVVHGGLPSAPGVTLDDIRKVDRFRQPPHEGIMSDLLWADPQDEPGKGVSKRGISYSFGPDVTADFLQRNNLDLLIRSHEMKDDGYHIQHGGKCITVFSAPKYCGTMTNKGAYIQFDSEMKRTITQFDSKQPPSKPAHMNPMLM